MNAQTTASEEQLGKTRPQYNYTQKIREILCHNIRA